MALLQGIMQRLSVVLHSLKWLGAILNNLVRLKLAGKARHGILPIVTEGTLIPKVIYQTYYTKHLPPILAKNVEKLKAMNPNWKHRVYDDADISDFIEREYGSKMLYYYNKININYGAARADLFRYLIIYRFGGVYLDIKSSTDFPLDDIILDDDRFVLSRWGGSDAQADGWGNYRELNMVGGREFQQWHIISVPGHPFLLSVINRVLTNIERYIPEIHGVGGFGVLRLTGPVAYTLAIAPLLNEFKYRLVEDNKKLGINYSMFKDIKHHRTAFGTHYTQLRTSIVNLSRLGHTKSFFYRNGRKLYNLVKKLDKNNMA